MLADTLGRTIGYLRLSLTKACAMRCLYCRPATLEHPNGQPLLSPGEIEQLVRHLVVHHGLHKIQLTGGDPTSRPELSRIIERLAGIDGVRDLAMTTNGLTLAHCAREYAGAGLRRVNISLDTLDPDRFAQFTGLDQLDRVLDGIDAARAAGLCPIKLNTVVMRGRNEQDLPRLLRFAATRNLEVRFIELMPMGPLADVWADRYVPEAKMRQTLDPHITAWTPIEQGAAAARRYHVILHDGTRATVGFITPMSCNFCANCNRIRLAADGTLYPCLMDQPAGSLLSALRPRFDGRAVDQRLMAGLSHKQPEHPHNGFVTMTHIGG